RRATRDRVGVRRTPAQKPHPRPKGSRSPVWGGSQITGENQFPPQVEGEARPHRQQDRSSFPNLGEKRNRSSARSRSLPKLREKRNRIVSKIAVPSPNWE